MHMKSEHADDKVCPICGFDPSLDYENFPTLAMLPENMPSASQKQADWEHSLQGCVRCKNCGSHLFTIASADNSCICIRCGTKIKALQAQPDPFKVNDPTPKKPDDNKDKYGYSKAFYIPGAL